MSKINFTVDLSGLTDDYGETIAAVVRSELEHQLRALVKKHIRAELSDNEEDVRKTINALSKTTLEKILRNLEKLT